MKNVLTLFIIFFCSNVVHSQRFYATVFDKLPQDYQLYPRNEKNEAQVPVSGIIELEGWSYFSVQVFRNKTLISYQKAPITYKGTVGTFSFTPFTIKAEKAEYDFKIFAVKDKDSLNLVTRANVVAGDVYVLTGQSNSTAFFSETKKNEFCRTFGKITGTYNIENYNPADTLWALSNQEVYFKNVGTLGYEFQKYILDNFGIPTCLINAGFHWSSARQHANRTASNPADLTNGYGRMLYRLQKAGVDKYVKALIYRQGETEAYGEDNDFGGFFDKFYNNLKIDLPSIKQVYAYQIDIIYPAVGDAPKVRETQRALADKYQNVQVLASLGTKGFDGLHYTTEGYTQNATELGWLVSRDFYGSTNTDNIDAPNIRKVYFSTADKSEITLTFPIGQELTWNEKTRNLLMKDFFYLDGVAGKVVSGAAMGNKIVLKLNASSTATKISFLPPMIESTSPDFPYTGPYITNKKGLRALSFYELLIEEMPVSASLTASTNGAYSIKLNWNAVPDAVNYILEREIVSTGIYQQIAKLDAKVLAFQDSTLFNNTQYNYRIKVIYKYSESNYASATAKTNSLLSTPVTNLSVIYYNEIKLSWNTIPNATYYVLERKTGTESLKFTINANVSEYIDKNVKANTSYTYMLKAFGNLTESLSSNTEGKTPAILETPVLQAEPLAFDMVKVSWKSIQNATSYTLERKLTETGDYSELAKLDASKIDFTDTKLKEKTSYYYRIKAFGDKTESIYSAMLIATTPTVLATEAERSVVFKLYPNPTNAILTLSFPKQVSGQISIVDFKGARLLEESIKQLDTHTIDVSKLPKGTHMLIFSNNDERMVKKFILE